MRTIEVDEALGAALGRHGLAGQADSVIGVTSSLVGLHNTSPVSPYLSLRARLARFGRDDLDRLMWEEWLLARLRAMRLTMFILPHDLLEIAAAAIRHTAEPLAFRWMRDAGVTAQQFQTVADQVETALSDGPMTVRGLRRALAIPGDFDLSGVVGRMCDLGRIVGGRAPRSWRSPVREYHRWADVLPGVDLRRWDEESAIDELIVRYIESYGPVTLDDIAWWTGIAKGRCRMALKNLGDSLEEVQVDDWPRPLFRLGDQERAAMAKDSVKALPMLDPYVQGYKDRARFLDPGRHNHVFDRGGNSAATLIRGGRVMGVWQFSSDPSDSIMYHLFTRQPKSVLRAAEAELTAAGELFFDHAVPLRHVSEMKALDEGGARSAAHPLDSRPHRS